MITWLGIGLPIASEVLILLWCCIICRIKLLKHFKIWTWLLQCKSPCPCNKYMRVLNTQLRYSNHNILRNMWIGSIWPSVGDLQCQASDIVNKSCLKTWIFITPILKTFTVGRWGPPWVFRFPVFWIFGNLPPTLSLLFFVEASLRLLSLLNLILVILELLSPNT